MNKMKRYFKQGTKARRSINYLLIFALLGCFCYSFRYPIGKESFFKSFHLKRIPQNCARILRCKNLHCCFYLKFFLSLNCRKFEPNCFCCSILPYHDKFLFPRFFLRNSEDHSLDLNS